MPLLFYPFAKFTFGTSFRMRNYHGVLFCSKYIVFKGEIICCRKKLFSYVHTSQVSALRCFMIGHKFSVDILLEMHYMEICRFINNIYGSFPQEYYFHLIFFPEIRTYSQNRFWCFTRPNYVLVLCSYNWIHESLTTTKVF